MGYEKCCCIIPLRPGTFIIASWFFIVYAFDAITGFLGINAVVIYSGQASKPWYYISLLLSILIMLGGLVGMIGAFFTTRKFAKTLSVIVWTNCVLSLIKYGASLGLMASHRNELVQSCHRSGFVGFNNNQVPLAPVVISDSPFYTPIQYPGTLNAHTSGLGECQTQIKTLLVAFGVVICIVELVQIYFGTVVNTYASRLRDGARHHRLHDQQIKEFKESKYHMSTVY